MAFFIRSYARRIEKDVKDVGLYVSRLEGQLVSMQGDLRSHAIEITKASEQLKAAWRFIDRAHERASDSNNGGQYE